MNTVRSLLVLLLLFGLAGCDSASDKPPKAPAPAPVTPAPVAPPLPAPPAVVPPPAPAPPAPPQEVAPVAPRRAEPRSLPAPPAPPAEAPAAVPRAPLDLSLPSDLRERFPQPSGTLESPAEPQPLLPPLFEQPNAMQQNSFELGGRLITNEPGQADEDNWHSVEGAELQLQFRR